jgi:cell division protein FtsB
VSIFFSTFAQNLHQDIMSRLNSVFLFLRRHKYMVVIFFIVLIVGFIDDNSFMNRFERRNKMGQLRSEIETYKTQYEAADRQLREMDSDPKSIEKMAREKYFMKRKGEDVFVIREAEEDEPDVVSSDSSIR